MSRTHGFVVALAATLASTPAAAQGNDAASARELFRAGQEEMTNGRVDAACTKFAEAQRLDPNVGYLVNLARCDEKRDRLADARESWSKALDLAKTRHDARLGDVQAGFDAIDKRVPRVVVHAGRTPPAGLVIRRDDVVLTAAALDVPLPINPGRHVVAASAPGRQEWTKELDVHAGDPVATIDVPDLAHLAERAPATPSEGGSRRDLPEPDANPGSAQRALGLVSAGVGVAAAGVGTFFMLRASSLNEDSKALCDPADTTSCSSEGVKMREDALGAADVATVTLVTAGVLVVVGAVLFFTAPSRPKQATTSFYGTALVHRF